MKPLILVFPFNLLSHYLRCLALAKTLSKDYEVQFAFSSEYNEFVVEDGFKTFSCLHFDSRTVTKAIQSYDFSWLNEPVLEAIFNRQVEVINRLKPVAVIGDTSPTVKMAAEKTKVQFISLMNGYMSKYYDGTRSITKNHFAYRYLKHLPLRIAEALTQKGEYAAFRSIQKPFNSIRRKNKLPPKRYYPDELEGNVNLICDLPEIFPQKQLPKNYSIIGPLFVSVNRRSGIGTLLNPEKKTIVVSMGSSGDWRKAQFLNNVTFERFNIVTAGDKEKLVSGSNVFSFEFLDMSEVLPLADVMICHGGNGTIYQALAHEVPLLCMPVHFEQEWNVERIQRLGLGKAIRGILSLDELLLIIEETTELKPHLKSHLIVKRLQEFDDNEKFEKFSSHMKRTLTYEYIAEQKNIK